MFDIEMFGVSAVLLIIGLVELVKSKVNKKYAGIVAWLLGVAIAFGFGYTEAGWTWFQCLLIGAALGLSASGLYSTQKNMREPSMHIGNLPDELNPVQDNTFEGKTTIQQPIKTIPDENPPE